MYDILPISDLFETDDDDEVKLSYATSTMESIVTVESLEIDPAKQYAPRFLSELKA